MDAAKALSRGFLLLSLSLSSLVAASGCTKQADVPPTRSHDAAVVDLPSADLGSPTRCTTSAQCDDGFACTIDGCGAGGLCAHTAIDAMCAADETCVVGRGCVTRGATVCTTNAECDDGIFCNGAERCNARVCITPLPETCDDGNACTTDTCDAVRDQCVRETAPGCDAGVLPGDGGSAPPFVAPGDYTGSFLFVPAQSSGCGAATFSISSVTFSNTGTTLTVQGGSFPMTQSPVPTDASFDVTYVQSGCGTYRLQGTFSDRNTFHGTWTAAFSGGCGICPDMSASVTGVRS